MTATLLQPEALAPAGAGARAVAAGDCERRRLERDLHDGAQQRLVALSLQLRLLGLQLTPGSEEGQLLAEARRALAESLEELRELARGLHPAVLTSHGLDVAIETLAARAPVPVSIEVATGRLPDSVEVAAYYLVSEALTNVAKYAQATSARVAITRRSERLVVEIADDGAGGADVMLGSGLRGLADRVEALGGRLLVVSPPGVGTTVHAVIPIADECEAAA